MNAYQIMMFLLLLNLSISIVNSVGIFNVGVNPEDYNASGYEAKEEYTASGDFGTIRFIGVSIASILSGAILGVFVGYLTQVPADSAIAYSIFTTTFWGLAYNASSVLWNFGTIAGDDYNAGIMMLLLVFFAVMAISFIAFLMQLVKGPWSTYQ